MQASNVENQDTAYEIYPVKDLQIIQPVEDSTQARAQVEEHANS